MRSMDLLLAAKDNGWNLVGAVALAAFALGFLLLFLTALVGVSRSSLPAGMKLVWVVFAFCAPFLGSALWFAVGRRTADRDRRLHRPVPRPAL